jgi:hypothetical protein
MMLIAGIENKERLVHIDLNKEYEADSWYRKQKAFITFRYIQVI